MKKGLIFAIVLLLGTILFLKYIQERSLEKERTSPAHSDSKFEGVALPAGAKIGDYGDLNVPIQYTADAGQIAILPEKYGKIGMCKDGTVKEILDNYSKLWGFAPSKPGSIGDSEKNNKLYSLVSELFACIGIVRNDYLYCNNLPGGVITYGNSLMTEGSNLKCRCEFKMFDAGANAYMAGLSKNEDFCIKYVSSNTCSSGNEDQEVISLLKNIDKRDFCKIMGKGMKGLLSSSLRLDPKLDKAKFSCYFPKNSADCSKCANDEKKECLTALTEYEVLKTGNFNKSDNMRKAFLRRSPKTCEAIAKKLSKTYCNYYKDLLKTTGNAPGMSDDDIKQHVAQLEEEAKEERKRKMEERLQSENDRKEKKKITKEVNDRVKKLLGKE